MKKIFFTICLLISSMTLGLTQAVITDFEDFNLEIDTFLNGSDFSGGFDGNGIFLPNSYEDTYGSWSGWSISSETDSTTPGFFNQYASISGTGADGSTHYATTFVSGESIIEKEEQFDFSRINVNNSTYAFLSMRDGDSFAKKFGGESGDDPDFFLLTIKGYLDGQVIPDSIDFYLADYRFDDNSLDYIIDEWTTINLSAFNPADSLSFSLSSSDNGAFGMNTPAYFCIDNIVVDGLASTDDNIHNASTSVYPNPTVDKLSIESSTLSMGALSIYNSQGQLVSHNNKYQITDPIDVSHLGQGQYYIEIKSKDNSRWTDAFIKE